MTRKLNCLLIFLLSVGIYDSTAQDKQILYFMDLPQNHFLNPAMQPSGSVYIGLPGISGLNVNINNNFFNFSDIFSVSQDGYSTISIIDPDFDVSGFIGKIKDINILEPQVAVQLFGLGFRTGKDLYIFFDVNERVDMNFELPGDLLRLGFEGNEQFLGDNIDLNSLRTEIHWYHEAGMGFSKNITDKLRLGIKGKLLFGMADFSLDNRAFELTVNEDYTHIVNADLTANIIAPVKFYINDDNQIDSAEFDDERFDSNSEIIDYLLSTGNIGMGVDIGANYSFSDWFKISASVTDLGYIKWKKDLTNLRAESHFELSGANFQEVYEGEKTVEELSDELLDSLSKSFYLTDKPIPYKTNLPFGIRAGACFSPSESFSIGLLSYTRITDNRYKEALTFSGNLNLGNAFSATVAYTLTNYMYDNIGFGLAFRLGFFQIYALADKIPLRWSKIISEGKEYPVPEKLNTIHAALGVNLIFGNKLEKRKTDKPMVLIQQ